MHYTTPCLLKHLFEKAFSKEIRIGATAYNAFRKLLLPTRPPYHPAQLFNVTSPVFVDKPGWSPSVGKLFAGDNAISLLKPYLHLRDICCKLCKYRFSTIKTSGSA